MIPVRDSGVPRYVFGSLMSDGIAHALFTRRGGFSHGVFASLNVGHTVGDDPSDVDANHEAICSALQTRVEDVVTAHQVHGDQIAVISANDGGRVFPQTDALVSNVPGLFLMLRFADCVPVFLSAPQQGAVGLAHAGWKGTFSGIAAKTVQAMAAAYGCEIEGIRAALGPAIGPCCFEVGPEVVSSARALFSASDDLLSRQQTDGKAHLDLWLANETQLREIGVTQIESSGMCTCCHSDEFYSHRGEGGHTGRFGALIGLRS